MADLKQNTKALLLDMNSTFMFGEDRFGKDQNYYEYYYKVGETLPDSQLNEIIESVYNYLLLRYPDEKYCDNFPSLETAVTSVTNTELDEDEVEKVIDTFSYHEYGHIPPEYVSALTALSGKYLMAAVIDIWSPKERWLQTFDLLGIRDIFSAYSFSSDHGCVKPSATGFSLVVDELNIAKAKAKANCLVVGDSERRDLGGARASGIDCVLVGGEKSSEAIASYPTLLELANDLL